MTGKTEAAATTVSALPTKTATTPTTTTTGVISDATRHNSSTIEIATATAAPLPSVAVSLPIAMALNAKPKEVMNDPRFRIRPIQQVASACTGGLLTATFMTPLDVVKTRLQAQQTTLAASNKCFLYCNGLMDHLCPCGPDTPTFKPPKQRLNGTIDAFIKISRSEGFGSLWSGLGPTMISALPSTIIYFVAYEQFKAQYIDIHYRYMARGLAAPRSGADIPFLIPLLAGVSARIAAVTVVSPVELIRTKMQSQKMTYGEIKEAIQTVIRNHGVRGLFRGLPPTILRDVPFSGIYWTCYESIKSHFGVVEPTFGFSFLAGALSGSVAAVITTPFDVIKTHEQIEFGEKVIFAEKPSQNYQSRSVGERMSAIYRVGGLQGVFAGLGPRLLKVAPACAIMISTFEYSKAFFYHYNVHKFNEHLMQMQTTQS